MRTTSFAATLLLSEVAVGAEVSNIIPGFTILGGPAVLLELSSVDVWRSDSPDPEYALVPLRSLVIGGSVFCDEDVGTDYLPQLGTSVIVIGAWGDKAVVPYGPKTTGVLLETKDDGTLKWIRGAGSDAPRTLADWMFKQG